MSILYTSSFVTTSLSRFVTVWYSQLFGRAPYELFINMSFVSPQFLIITTLFCEFVSHCHHEADFTKILHTLQDWVFTNGQSNLTNYCRFPQCFSIQDTLSQRILHKYRQDSYLVYVLGYLIFVWSHSHSVSKNSFQEYEFLIQCRRQPIEVTN